MTTNIDLTRIETLDLRTPSELNDEELLLDYEHQLALQATVTERAGRLEWEIRKRTEARGAQAIPSNDFICELKTRNTYDSLAFTPLKEILQESDLNICLTPAHQETVTIPDKWNATKVKTMARHHGDAVQQVLNQATMHGTPRLVFERREGTKYEPT